MTTERVGHGVDVLEPTGLGVCGEKLIWSEAVAETPLLSNGVDLLAYRRPWKQHFHAGFKLNRESAERLMYIAARELIFSGRSQNSFGGRSYALGDGPQLFDVKVVD